MAGWHSLLQQMSNTVSEYTRLARSGAGYYQYGAVYGCYRLSLYRIQFVEE